MVGRSKDGCQQMEGGRLPYWQRPSTRREPFRSRPVALQETPVPRGFPESEILPTAGPGTEPAGSFNCPADILPKEEAGFESSEVANLAASDSEGASTGDESDSSPQHRTAKWLQSAAYSGPRLAIMEGGGYISTTKIDRFCGRPGTVQLREFRACFYSMMDEWEVKLQQHYSQRYAFKMLGWYVTDEAQLIYFDHKSALIRDVSLPNAAYAAAIAAATQAELQVAVRAHAASADAAVTPVPTTVVLTPAQLLAATHGIPPTTLVAAEPDPVGVFFTILEREFPTKNTQKIQELRNITRLKGETLKMLYRRVLRLVEETGNTTPQGAAQKFLRALKADSVLHAKVKDRIFHDLGDAYTCQDVYLAAERYEMANAHYEAHEDEVKPPKREVSPSRARTTNKPAGQLAKGQYNSKTAHAAIVSSAGTQAFGCNYCASSEHTAPQCSCPPTSLHCSFCNREGHVEAVCFGKHPERRTMKGQRPAANTIADSNKGGKSSSTVTADKPAAQSAKKPTPRPKATQEANQAEAVKVPDLSAEIEALKAQVSTLTVSMAARAAGGGSGPSSSGNYYPQRYGLPYDALMAFEEGQGSNRAARWKEYRQYMDAEEAQAPHLNFHERPQTRGVGLPNQTMVEHVMRSFLPLPDYAAIREAEAGIATRRSAAVRDATVVPREGQGGPAIRARGARAAVPMSFQPMTQEQESRLVRSPTPPEVVLARETSLPSTPESSAGSAGSEPGSRETVIQDGVVHSPLTGISQECAAQGGFRPSNPPSRERGGRVVPPFLGHQGGPGDGILEPTQLLERVMAVPLLSFQELGWSPAQVVQVLSAGLPAPQVAVSTREEPQQELSSPPLVQIRRAVRHLPAASSELQDASLVPFPKEDASLTGMLVHAKALNSAVLHQAAKGLPVVPPSERMVVNLGAVLVDTRQGAITVNGMVPRVALLDTGAQPVLLGAAFAVKLGLVGSSLQTSAWRIRTAGGQVEKVQGETSQFLSIVFNPETTQALELRLRCLVTAATSYDILLGQEALFPPGVTINNWTEQAYYRSDWEGMGKQFGFLPLDLHGTQMGAAALSALKEACMATYEEQSAELEVDGAEGPEFHDALPTFSVEPAIQYQPETVQLLRNCKTSMQEALHKMDSVVTTGVPSSPVQPICSSTIHWMPPDEGITLVELFGGMAAGLEALLKAGMRVKRYIHCDISTTARTVAEARFTQLQEIYPTQLAEDVFRNTFTTLPADITLIQLQHFQMMGEVHLLIAGWECQGFSPAGKGQGLEDHRTGLFADLVRIIGRAQQCNPNIGYILENTPAQFDARPQVKQDYAVVQHMVGTPLLLDAVQCGSLAHRLRNMWSNLAPSPVLQLALQYTIRDPSLTVAQILDEDTICKPVQKAERAPWFPVNQPGQPRAAWPTLVSYPGSHAFRGEGTGMVQRHGSDQWEAPTAEERERAMGFRRVPQPTGN